MRRALAIAAAAALLAAVAPAQAAAPLPTQVRELGKRLTALEKRVAKVTAQRAKRGPKGPPGPAGLKGPAGDPGPRGAVIAGVPFIPGFEPSGSLGTAPSVVVSVSAPGGGPYFLRGGLVVRNTAAQPATVTCNLKIWIVGNNFDTAVVKLGPAGGPDTRTVSLMDAFSFAPFPSLTEQIACAAAGVPAGSVTFEDADLLAVPVTRILGNLGHL
ncbi:MAG: hypothetical protein AB7O78_03500 [Thermoleophilia bacterium]